jgi:hypothetical protein
MGARLNTVQPVWRNAAAIAAWLASTLAALRINAA